VKLRQYQKDVLNDLIRVERTGKRRIILQAATGSGKTVMAAALVKAFVDKGKKVLFLAHRRELIIQTSDKLTDFGVRHGVIMANHKKENNFAPVQVASVDTLRARAITKNTMEMPVADLIIIDEAHRSLSNTYIKIINLYKKGLIVGLTATPVRSDGNGLGSIYTDMVKAPGIKELTRLGSLIEAIYYSPSIPDLKGIGLIAGDYNAKELSTRMDLPKLVGDVVRTWKHIANGKQTLVFASGVKHSQNLCETFVDNGILAAHLDGQTPTKERVQILKDFNSGKLTVICNCMVLTEGFDAPKAQVCVLARPTKSLGLYIQMVGRVLRPHPSKDKAIVIDHSGAVYTNGFATDDHNWVLTVGKSSENERVEPKDREASTIVCEGCFRTFSGHNICPGCGKIHKGKSSYVDFIDAELGLVNKKTKKVERKEEYGENFKKEFYQQLLGYGVVKNYNDSWANYKYKERFDSYPNFKDVVAEKPNKETMSYIKHLQIKWAKRRK